eukprot:symbB.v1.2.025245.t1/scaffold2441.1/size78965/3
MLTLVNFLAAFAPPTGRPVTGPLEAMQLCDGCASFQLEKGHHSPRGSRWYCEPCWESWHRRGEIPPEDEDEEAELVRLALEMSLQEETMQNVETERAMLSFCSGPMAMTIQGHTEYLLIKAPRKVPEWLSHKKVRLLAGIGELKLLVCQETIVVSKYDFEYKQGLVLKVHAVLVDQQKMQVHRSRGDVSDILRLTRPKVVPSAKGPLAGAFVQLIDCEALVSADHGVVQLALMEIYVRYGKLLAFHPDLFPRYGQRVLQALVGRGIRSNNPQIVSRACFMFGRFVKIVKTQAAPLLSQIQEALQDLLVVQYVPSALLPVQAEVSLTKIAIKGSLKADDQGCLYEALASLVTSAKVEEQRSMLETLLKGPAQTLSEILSRSSTDLAGCAGWAGRSIEAIATVSKAFTVQHASTVPAWEEVLLVVARILEKFVNQMGKEIGLWRAALFLCRRM